MAKGRKTGGRVKGSKNKQTFEVKTVAQSYAKEAVERLAYLMLHAESEAAQVAAIKEILDRAVGKSAQPQTGEDGEGPVRHVLEVLWAGMNGSRGQG